MKLRRMCSLFLLASQASLVHAQQLAQRFPAYRLQRSDVVEVKFRYTPEFDQTITVGPDGHVSLTGLGDFVAQDLTVQQFHDRLIVLAKTRLVDPDVTVTLKDFEKPHVFVEGEVYTPGRVELRSNITITDAIALAGGFRPSGKQSEVMLLRRANGSPSITRVIDVKKLVDHHNLQESLELQPGDVIYVPQNGLSKAERFAHLGQFGAIYNPIP